MQWAFCTALLLLHVTISKSNGAADYLTFLEITGANATAVELNREDDGVSGSIEIPDGFPLGDGSRQDRVYVATNGILSFGTPFLSHQPSPFTSTSPAHSYLVAPFWSDVNTEIAGTVSYAVYGVSDDGIAVDLLEQVSSFIRGNEIDADGFFGQWMLVAYWDRVAKFDGSETSTNTFQAILITNGTQSYAVFTYRCGLMDWSDEPSVIGTKIATHFTNHYLTGFTADTRACLSGNWTNAVYQLHAQPTEKEDTSVERCEDASPSVSRNEVDRYGSCVPFQAGSRDDNPCIPLFQENNDYVYVPNTRISLQGINRWMVDASLVFNVIKEPCKEIARKLVCRFYYPPCGNSTHFEPPKSICKEMCSYTLDACPSEFQRTLEFLRGPVIATNLKRRGLNFINCSDPGKPIRPLDHCCYDAGIVREVPSPVQSLESTSKLTSFELSWSAPLLPYGVITAYEVSHRIQGGNELGKVNTTNVSTAHTLTKLRPQTAYTVTVRAYNMVGAGKETSINIVTASEPPTDDSTTELPESPTSPPALSAVPDSQDSLDTTVIIAAVVPAVFVLLVVLATVIVIVCRWRYVKSRGKLLPGFSYSLSSPGSPPPTPSSPGQRYWREGFQHPPRPLNVSRGTAQVASGYLRQMSEGDQLIPARHITLLDCIGKGEFGMVYRAHLVGWQERATPELVAVKTIKAIFTMNDINEMVQESLKMRMFDHPHVLKLIGVSIDAGEAPYLVMPYMANGSLLSYLRKERANLTIAEGAEEELITNAYKRLLSMCLQIAKGMEYLAMQKFVHRDLAARNCMMDTNGVIKVADFGLSEDVYARNYFKQGNKEGVRLPIRWMAIESIRDGLFTQKTDVWSFGVTCWEVFTLGRSPYAGVDSVDILKHLESGGRLEKPSNAACSDEIYLVLVDCWMESPEKRPTFRELVAKITKALESVAGYMDFGDISGSGAQSSCEPAARYDHLSATERDSGGCAHDDEETVDHGGNADSGSCVHEELDSVDTQ